MTILVDLDNVLINTSEVWIEILNDRHHTSVEYDKVDEWDVSKFFPNLIRDEVFDPLVTGEVWDCVSPIGGAQETIEKLIGDGHDVYIVTASSFETIGKKWRDVITRFFPMIKQENVIVAHKKHMIKGDVLIDDAVFNFDGGDSFNILFDTPHNRSESSGNFVRSNDWNEIYTIICNLKTIYDYKKGLIHE